MGNSYYNGEGVEKNFVEAVKWYRLSAEQGNAEAQFCLGYCYYSGAGVEKNDAEASAGSPRISSKRVWNILRAQPEGIIILIY